MKIMVRQCEARKIALVILLKSCDHVSISYLLCETTTKVSALYWIILSQHIVSVFVCVCVCVCVCLYVCVCVYDSLPECGKLNSISLLFDRLCIVSCTCTIQCVFYSVYYSRERGV